jgi:hypothetical protein
MTKSLVIRVNEWAHPFRMRNLPVPPFFALQSELDELGRQLVMMKGEPPADGKTRIDGVEVVVIKA